jgi:hypothetical protein
VTAEDHAVPRRPGTIGHVQNADADQATAIACLDRAISAASRAGDRVAEGRALLRKSFVALYGQKNPHDRGGGGLTIIFGAARELRPWQDLPAVRDTYDRLLTLMTTA